MQVDLDTTVIGDRVTARKGVSSLRIVTEPNNLGEFIEVQVAQLRDGSLNVVMAGTPHATLPRDQRGFYSLRIWPAAKATDGGEPNGKT